MPSVCFVFPLLFLLFIFPISAHPFHHDQQSLLAFKSLITGDPHHSMAKWSPAVPLCNWTAVSCSRLHVMDRVVALNLTAMDLRGLISPSLGNLSFLCILDLSHNAFHGHIPSQLGNLFRLKKLRLSYNHFEGSIPSHLASCRNLSLLALAFNNLSGNLPVELGSLEHLKVLDIQTNDATGY